MDYNDIIKGGRIVYRSQSSDKGFCDWHVKETNCHIKFFTTEPISQEEKIILHLLNDLNDDITKEDLGIMLGFNVKDNNLSTQKIKLEEDGYIESNFKFYKDEAEINLFNDFIKTSFEWNLIKEYTIPIESTKEELSHDNNTNHDNEDVNLDKNNKNISYIKITKIGKYALEKGVKLNFYEGDKSLIENNNRLTNDKEADKYFPFYEALGISSTIHEIKRIIIDPDEEEIEHYDELIKRLELQSERNDQHIYSATLSSEFSYKTYYADFRLYSFEGNYYPIVFYRESPSNIGNSILYSEEENSSREIKTENGLWYMLINTNDSIIDYHAILPLQECIDKSRLDLIIKDKRTAWEDEELYNFIVCNENTNSEEWELISIFCPTNILEKHINEVTEKVDWQILSGRLNLDFVMHHLKDYPWNVNNIMSRGDITKDNAQKLMLAEEIQDNSWDFDLIEKFLDLDFVKRNANRLNVNYYSLTAWLQSKNSIETVIGYENRNWDWILISQELPLKSISQHLSSLGNHLSVPILLDRICTDRENINMFIDNQEFIFLVRQSVVTAHTGYSLLEKNSYVWDDKLISFFEETKIIKWNSTDYNKGFCQYSYIKWDYDFFSKYHDRINNQKDIAYISNVINDIKIIEDFPEFAWDWEILSSNLAFKDNLVFLNAGKDKVYYSKWLSISSLGVDDDLINTYGSYIHRSEDLNYISQNVNTSLCLSTFPDFNWNWNYLSCNKNIVNNDDFINIGKDKINTHVWITAASTESIEKYFDLLRIPSKIDTNEDWTVLTKKISSDFIYNHIWYDWDKSVLTNKMIPYINKDDTLLITYKLKWDWNILSHELDRTLINKNLKQFADRWNWNLLSELISSNITLSSLLDEEIVGKWNWEKLSKALDLEILTKIVDTNYTLLTKDIANERLSKYEKLPVNIITKSNLKDFWDWNSLSINQPIQNIKACLEIVSDNWNWEVLTSRLDLKYIISKLSYYSDKWDWESLLNHRINADILQDAVFLKSLSAALNQLIPEKALHVWRVITRKFDHQKLNELTEQYTPDEGFLWDYSFVYDYPFNLEDFIQMPHKYIDWKELSASQSANSYFKLDDRTFERRTWRIVVKNKLDDKRFKWDFKSLTRLEEVQKEHGIFLSLHKEDWDWDYISRYGICLLTNNNGDANLKKYKEKINFKLVSLRTDINIDDSLLEQYIGENWDWKALSSNESVNINLQFVLNHKEKGWDWSNISSNTAFKWNNSILDKVLKYENIAKELSWRDIVSKTEIMFNKKTIEEIHSYPIDWNVLSTNPSFEANGASIDIAVADGHINDIEWSAISRNNKIDIETLTKYKEYLLWDSVTSNRAFNINDNSLLSEFGSYLNWEFISDNINLTNEDLLLANKQKLDWSIINLRLDYSKITLEFIEKFSDVLDWQKVSQVNLNFNEGLLKKYRDKWYWNELLKNDAFKNIGIDINDVFKDEINGAIFVNEFDNDPKVYHFTHLFNAIDVLKSRKILSRNRAKELGLLKFDSAGGVVGRTAKAHPFARFYYRPKTPTQFYNECLGWDKNLTTNWDKPKSYFGQALKLGLPKCPEPIFFEFSLKEIIAKMPELCYYSDGNLQTNSAIVYKVSEHPLNLSHDYLYSNMQDAIWLTKQQFGSYVPKELFMSVLYRYLELIKNQSQQEFLVKGEFDFSTIDSLKVYCYDQETKKMLCTYLGDDPILNKIYVDDSGLFSHNNRSLYFSEGEDNLTISSDYDNEDGSAYILIKGEPIISNPQNVLNESAEGIVAYPEITLRKPLHNIQIYFVDLKARTKNWLIYKA